MTEKNNMVIFIMGVSGSGKSTLLQQLIKEYATIAQVKSYTSRPKRESDKILPQYHFISNEEFLQGIQKGEFLEYALVHQKYYYGTKIADIQKFLDEGKIPIKEIDIKGLEILKSKGTIPFKFFSIFLNISEKVMIKRIKGRDTIDSQELERRLISARSERIKAKILCDKVIDGDKGIDEIFQTIKPIIDTLLTK